MQPEQIQALVKRYLDGTATPAEKQLLDQWYQEGQSDPIKWFAQSQHEEELLRLEMLHEIKYRTGLKKPATLKRLWIRIPAAASILLALSIGAYFVAHKKQPIQIAQNQPQDIAPGTNKAILTLSNGKKIVVTGAGNGVLATQANTAITKSGSGLSYEASIATNSSEVLMNNLSTQAGGETSLTLADGTEVKLDAESSITYPVVFTGKERRVTVSGQVYFKVKHNAKQPFSVIAGDQTIQDIGTEFNINTYDKTITTLVEGSVSVNNKILKPGQQISDDKISSVDVNEVAGWAKGRYEFNGQNIHQIVDQIKRWYNIEVTYEPGVSNEKFYATLDRTKNISSIFHNLSYSNNVHFKIEGRRVTVMK